MIHDDSRTRDEWGRISDQTGHKAYHTSLHSDTICPVRIQMWRHIRLNKELPESKLGWALNTADSCVSCTNKRGLRITHNSQLWQIRYITRVAQNKEKQQRKTRGRHPSANRERQPWQISFMKKLDYTSRFVRVISTLSPNQSSHNSVGHGGRYNMVITASTSQQF